MMPASMRRLQIGQQKKGARLLFINLAAVFLSLTFTSGFWQFFSGQFRVPHCRIVYECSYYCCSLREVSCDEVIIAVHIGMVGTCVVFNFILYKLEARDANR